MTTRTTCLRQEPRASLANPATMIVVAMITAMTFSASGAAPTPLYHLYQEHFGLTPALITVIFAAYALSLLLALLTTGALSDHVGRRPTVLGALMLNIIAMVLFITAGSGAALIAARAVQGFATGVATAALGAAILDVDQRRGAVLNSVTVFAGLTVGTLGAATLVTFAPDPAHLVYVVLLTLSGIEALLIWHMPETAQTKPGALTSLRPHVSIPIQARQTLAQLTPVTFASWALGGFYFSLMPALVRVAIGATLPIVGGLVVAALTFSSVIAVLSLLSIPADRVLLGAIPALALGVAITLGGGTPSSSPSCCSAQWFQVWDSAPCSLARSEPSCRSPRLTNVRVCCRPSISKVTWRSACPPCSQDFWSRSSVCPWPPTSTEQP